MTGKINPPRILLLLSKLYYGFQTRGSIQIPVVTYVICAFPLQACKSSCHNRITISQVTEDVKQ